jgi:uncharacterized protein with NRDE domain
MCTLAIYFRRFDGFPIVIAANRDEARDRPSAPFQQLADAPRAWGGRDLRAGGTWLGVNEHGVVAGILNRRIERDAGRPYRSRGLLCLEALSAARAAEAAARAMAEEPLRYRPFTLLVADSSEAYLLHQGESRIEALPLEPGLHVLGNVLPPDPSAKRSRAHGLFAAAAKALEVDPRSAEGEAALRAALSDHRPADGSGDPRDSICVHAGDYGTVSSSLVVYSVRENAFYTAHALGPPCSTPFDLRVEVALGGRRGPPA